MDAGAARADRLRHEISAGRPGVVDEVKTNLVRDVLEPDRAVGSRSRSNRGRGAGPAAEQSEIQAQQEADKSPPRGHSSPDFCSSLSCFRRGLTRSLEALGLTLLARASLRS